MAQLCYYAVFQHKNSQATDNAACNVLHLPTLLMALTAYLDSLERSESVQN